MSHDGRAVANYILDRCGALDRPISHLSLQKIIYFCHAWVLTRLRAPLVKHDFEAWQYGPVLPYIYRDFKDFDREPIRTRATKLDPSTGRSKTVEYAFDAETKVVLDRVIDFYSKLSPGTLVELSHTEGGPWDVVWNHRGRVNPGMRITNETIMERFPQSFPPF